MTIPAEVFPKSVRQGILDKLETDLGTELELNTKEPTYYGSPVYIAAWPCVVAPPQDLALNAGGREGTSPFIGDITMNHQLVYVYESDEGVDPYPTLEERAGRIVDWLVYCTIQKDFPEDDDDNDLFHFYVPPYRIRLNNEYDYQLKSKFPDMQLNAVVVEFATRRREPLSQLT